MPGQDSDDDPTDVGEAPADAPARFHEAAADDTQADGAARAAIPSADPDPGYTASGVPTFDAVREKIETRFGTSVGAVELSSETPEGRRVEEQYEERQRAAAERLAQIRESMHPKDKS